jgi:hypothetical protein
MNRRFVHANMHINEGGRVQTVPEGLGITNAGAGERTRGLIAGAVPFSSRPSLR